MPKEAKVTSLPTMLGSGEEFFVGDKSYKVRPLKLKEVDEFLSDNISVGAQLFNVVNKDMKEKVDKWLQRCFTKGDKPLTLQMAMDDDWDLADLKVAIQRLIDISG